jgi:ABC-type transport system involved in cytochrome c biogenesis permease component
VTLEPEKIADLRVKHLEMLQTAISRMASQSASSKGFCITLTTALLGLAVANKLSKLGVLSFGPILAFALLDTQYLRLERRFRAAFQNVSLEDWSAMPSFKLTPAPAAEHGYWACLCSWSILAFYLPLSVGVGAILALIRATAP